MGEGVSATTNKLKSINVMSHRRQPYKRSNTKKSTDRLLMHQSESSILFTKTEEGVSEQTKHTIRAPPGLWNASSVFRRKNRKNIKDYWGRKDENLQRKTKEVKKEEDDIQSSLLWSQHVCLEICLLQNMKCNKNSFSWILSNGYGFKKFRVHKFSRYTDISWG